MKIDKLPDASRETMEDKEAEQLAELAERVKEISEAQEMSLAEYYRGDLDKAIARQADIGDLLSESIEGDYPSSVFVTIENDDGNITLFHPDQITEPRACRPNRFSILSERVTFTDAYGRVRTIICKNAEAAKSKGDTLRSRGFSMSEIGDRRNQVLESSNIYSGVLVRVDTNEPQRGNYPKVKDSEYRAQDYPIIDQQGKIHFSIKDKDGFSTNWDDPNASWNLNDQDVEHES